MASTWLQAPPSDSTVRVRMIDTTSIMTIASQSFLNPVVPGHDTINCTDVAFLIENQQQGRRVLFDAGVRKDFWNLPPLIQKRFGDIIPGLKVDKDVTEILEEHNVQLELIGQYHRKTLSLNFSTFPICTITLNQKLVSDMCKRMKDLPAACAPAPPDTNTLALFSISIHHT